MGKYVSSENGEQPITCNRTSVDDWEKFELIKHGDGTVSFKGNNGKYISNEGGKSMTCNRGNCDGWEKFHTH
uniref:Uncharacterized protein n=1 Tax=Acrobeloides nanus TaxID=290746 RepID=A0A914DUD9_9BILA